MTSGTHRLPTWLADGPEVSDLAWRIANRAIDAPRSVRAEYAHVTTVEVVADLVAQFVVDEYDVLLALAELQEVGAMAGPRPYDWARDGG